MQRVCRTVTLHGRHSLGNISGYAWHHVPTILWSTLQDPRWHGLHILTQGHVCLGTTYKLLCIGGKAPPPRRPFFSACKHLVVGSLARFTHMACMLEPPLPHYEALSHAW